MGQAPIASLANPWYSAEHSRNFKTFTLNNTKKFVLLAHTFPANYPRSDHWDLMLEDDGTLLTWELEKPFGLAATDSTDNGQTIVARRLDDHRLDYLVYEGQISGGRGSVKRILSGEFCWTNNEKTKATLAFNGSQCSLEIRDENIIVNCQQ